MFDDETTKRKEILQACENILKYAGYKIVSPFLQYDVSDVTGPSSLLKYFNDLRYRYCGEIPVCSGVDYINEKHMSLFIKSRQEVNGCSKKVALKECCAIIYTIFTNLKQFNLKNTPQPYMLGQKKCGWITQKALDIIEAQYKEHLKEEFAKIEAKASSYYSDADFGLLGDY